MGKAFARWCCAAAGALALAACSGDDKSTSTTVTSLAATTTSTIAATTTTTAASTTTSAATTTTAAPTTTLAPSSRPTLRNGDSGQAVVELQYSLNTHGFKVKADGKFGSETEAAVRAFQTAQHLTVDGIVGRQTWTALGF